MLFLSCCCFYTYTFTVVFQTLLFLYHIVLVPTHLKIQYIFQKFLCMVDGHDIFGSGYFLIFFPISWMEKMAKAKKIVNIKKSVFSCPSTTGWNFWNLFILKLYFCNCLPKLWIFIYPQLKISQKTFLVKNHFKCLVL